MTAPKVTVLRGDCVELMRGMAADSVDAIVTDPPYGIDFMGKEWDGFGTPHGFQTWTEQWAREAFRILKPGGHLLAFGGTRMYHRLATGVEDAGFEVRDMMSWLYGSGFPKSLDVSKAMDKRRNDAEAKWAVADFLKPHCARYGWKGLAAHFGVAEPMVRQHWASRSQTSTPTWSQWLELKTLLGFGNEMDQTVLELNGRKGTPGEAWAEREVVGVAAGNLLAVAPGQNNDRSAVALALTAPATDEAKRWEGWGTALKPAQEPIVVARKPLIGTVAENVLAHGTGAINIGASRLEGERWPANILFDEEAAAELDRQAPGASRFFYVAKPGKKERNAGGAANIHPTVKPIALMSYLIKLVTPPGGVVLDPFLGSGSTACAAAANGFDCIGIEQNQEYADIAEARIAHWAKEAK